MSEQKRQTFLVTWKIKKLYTVLSLKERSWTLISEFEIEAPRGKESNFSFMDFYSVPHCDEFMIGLELSKIYRRCTYRFFLLDPNNVVFRSSGIFNQTSQRWSDSKLLIKTSDLLREMSFWSEDTLTIQCLIEYEPDLMLPYPDENSTTSCEILSELYNKSEFQWSFKIPDFQGWTASRVTHVADTPLKVTFRYVDDELKIAFALNFKDLRIYLFKCNITLMDDKDCKIIEKSEKFVVYEEVFEFPHSFSEKDLQIARCYSLHELRLKFVFCNTYIWSQEFYDGEDSETATNTESASSLSLRDRNARPLSGAECFSHLQQDLRNLLVDKKFSDIKLRTDDELFSAHKTLLAARSPVFSAMFDQDMVESQTGIVDVIDVDAKTLKSFLEYIYTSSVDEMDEEIALNLLIAADKYQVVPLTKKCSAYLKSVLSLTNACKVLLTADMVDNDDLKSSSMEYITDNSTKILTSSEWLQLLKTNNTLATDVLAEVSKKFDDRTK